MEPEKKRTKEDTWKSDELKKHLRVSQSDSQSEDKKQKEKKLQRDRKTHDMVDYKGYIHKDQDKDRGKAEERTSERERFKSSERDRDKLRDRESGKDHHREREREKLKEKDQEIEGEGPEKEKHITRKDKEKVSDKEGDRKYRRDDLKQMLIENNLKASGGRDKEQRRRRESKDQLEQANIRDDVKERRHTERKVKEGKKSESKNSLGEFLTKKDEEGGHRHKSHRDQELNKDRGRSHIDKREHSVRGGKERPSKERSHGLFVKDGEEKYVSRRRKEGSSIEDRERQLSKNNEKRQREENERKKRDLKNSEHKKQGKSLREEEETSLQHERNARDKGKSIEREKKEDTSQRPHQGEHVSAWKPMQRQKREEEPEIGDNYLTNYEDDFEDYEDDFDDDDNEDNDNEARDSEERLREIPVSKKSEIEEIQRAINAENERIGTLLPKQIKKKSEKEPNMERQDSSARGSLCGMFMDFETANQRQSSQIMATKQKKRSSELLRLIDLDFSVSFSLLDLPPVNEYDMYIRNFGKTNTKQAYVQSNEDNLERDVQTDEIETLEKWTQHPGDSVLVSGGPRSSNGVSTDIVVTPKIDSQRLTNFLRSACQVIAVLLEEDRVATQPRWNLRSRQTSLSISDSCFQLNTNLPFLHDGILSSLNHTYPVLAIEPVSTSVYKEQNYGLSHLSSQEEMSGLSFQIASMDENGTLNLWVAVELQKVDLAGSQSDLGLIPGGKVKLVHSSTVQLNSSLFPKDILCLRKPQTLNIKFLPSNPNHFIVGTDIGVVSHGARHDLRVPPKLFKPQQGGPRSIRANAVDFSPFGKPIFLVGCSDGSIRLHQMTSEHPLIQWNDSTNGQPVIALQWALTRPAVFFALDASSTVYIWDLLENDLCPVAKQIIQSDKVMTMVVLGEPEKTNGLLGIALAKQSGIIDIQYVKKRWALPQSEESEKLQLLLEQSL
nr:WD repeat-containing protein 60 isoform X6 [Chelonoidis abingdonii]